MFHLKTLFAALAIFKIASSLPLADEIQPVDLAHICIEAEASVKNQDKSPILLIHGLGGSHKNWIGTDLLLAVRTKRRVCAVDLRNHGDSPWNNRSDIAALTVDIGHFLDTQNIKKVNIIGHSIGGKVAVHYTLNNPDRVDSLIVEDFRPNTLDINAVVKVRILFRILKYALESVPEGMAEDAAKKSVVDSANLQLQRLGVSERIPDHFAAYIDIKLVDGKWRYKYNMNLLEKAVNNPSKFLTESKGLYEGLTLFIYGSKSPFRVWTAERNIYELFPKAEMVPVDGASHYIHELFSREFNDVVVRLLNRVS